MLRGEGSPMSTKNRCMAMGLFPCGLWDSCYIFLRPFVSVIICSLSKIEYLDTGHRLVFRGLDNFRRALLEDPDIIRMMADSIKDIPVTVITIVIVSLAIAVVLNRKFFGRTERFRAIFFVPVIVASGIVISILNGDAMASTMMAGQKSSSDAPGFRDEPRIS